MTTPVYKWQPTTRVIAEKAGVSEADVIRFDQNTIGKAPGWVTRFLEQLDFAPNEYPQSDYFRLREAIARYRSCPIDSVLVGAGADDMIAVCAATFLDEGSTALAASPTYSLYRVATAQRRATYRPLERSAPAWRLPVEELIAAAGEASMIWLCEPNNPTGTRDTDDDLRTVLSSVSVPIVIDAAYAEFTDDDWWPWVEQFPNLIVLGTFSKAHGLAAARVGYALAAPEMAAALNRYRPPGSVSTVSAALAAEAARHPEHAAATVAAVREQRSALNAALADLGWRMSATSTNFVIGHVGSQATTLKDALMWEDGLVVRGYPAGTPLEGHLRVTVRRPDENDRLLAAVRRRMQ